MPKERFVQDLKRGVEFDDVFCIVDARPRRGKGPITFTLRDRTGDRLAKKWVQDSPDREFNRVADAEYARVVGRVEFDSFDHCLAATVQEFEPVERPDRPADFLPRSSVDEGDLRGRLRETIRSIGNPFLSRVLKQVFGEPGVAQAYLDAPAAKSMHHPYVGGLAEHSLEVAGAVDALSNCFPDADRDLVVTAALLHDIGKVDEIDRGHPDFGYTRRGGLIGHVYLGTERVRRVIDRIDGFPIDLAERLAHLMVSHHGALEWGAPVVPSCFDAVLLHMADRISVEAYQFRKAQELAGRGDFQFSRELDRWVLRAAPAHAPEIPVLDARPRLRDVRETVITGYSDRFVEPLPPIPLPVRGTIAAGPLATEEERVDDDAVLEACTTAEDGDYLLRVRGDSMVGAAISDGDYIQVRRATEAAEGDVVVALVEGENTLKRLVIENGEALLRAENPAYEDIPLQHGLTVQGIVVAVLERSAQPGAPLRPHE